MSYFHKYQKVFSVFASIIILSGCSSSGYIGSRELNLVRDQDTDSLGGLLDYTNNLAGMYVDLASKNSAVQDILAGGIIGAAATASGGILYNSHLDLISGSGLVAGTTAAVNNYLKPGEASKHLLNAAEQLVCIEKQGRKLDHFIIPGANVTRLAKKNGLFLQDKNGNFVQETFYQPGVFEIQAIDLVSNSIQSTRINLHKSLRNEFPNYQSVLAEIRNINPDDTADKFSIISGKQNTIKEQLNLLRLELNKCILSSV